MARTVASLPAGSRITDYISLGVITKFFPLEKVRAILAQLPQHHLVLVADFDGIVRRSLAQVLRFQCGVLHRS
jgi:hypothetical protein